MTSYDGKEITYDEIGNPLTYGDWELAWERGRQLSHLDTGEHDISYKYNESGLRTEKTVDGVRTEYIWDGTQLIYENNGSRETMYYYDAAGQLIGFVVNGSTYYYVRNVQGDIIKILDGNMEEVVEYKYDTWGRVIGMEGSDYGKWVGSLNPFRYRGYYYDDETGMYYLQSRYYNPDWGRFLNADTDLFANLKNNQHNIYAYCSNNPIAFSDPNGCYPIKSYTPGIVRYEYYDYVEILHTDTGTMEVYLIDRKKTSSSKDAVVLSSNRGEPNSTQDLYDRKGNLVGRRYFGPDGWAKTDEHFTDHGNPKRHKVPHKHDWELTPDGKWQLGKAYSMPSDVGLGLGIVLVASVAIAWVVVNDVTGVGVADDFALVPLSTAVATGVSMIV